MYTLNSYLKIAFYHKFDMLRMDPIWQVVYSYVLMQIFGLVTWRHQRRPFVWNLACKTRKTRRGLAGGASFDDQVSQVFLMEREPERERVQRIMNCPFIISILPFYIPVCYMSLLPLSSTRLHVDVSYLPWLDLTGFINIEGFLRPRLSSVRNPTWRANLTPPWVGKEYSLTYIYKIY